MRREGLPTCEETMPLLPPETTLFPSNLLGDPAEPDSDARWWVIHTKPRAEKSLARKLLAMGVGFYLPTRHQSWHSNGRRFESHLPLFPGYVFLSARPEDRRNVFSTGLVATVLSVPNQAELTEDLQRVHRILSARLPVEHRAALPPGASVEVIDGVLQGLTGTVVRPGRRTGVYIQVRLIGQGVLVELDQCLLRPAEQLIAI
jgi:transcriptional antiterminator RfaH